MELIELLNNSDEWVVKNLNKYGNSLLPKDIYKVFDVEVITDTLSDLVNKAIKIKIVPNEYGPIYIAEVINDKV